MDTLADAAQPNANKLGTKRERAARACEQFGSALGAQNIFILHLDKLDNLDYNLRDGAEGTPHRKQKPREDKTK